MRSALFTTALLFYRHSKLQYTWPMSLNRIWWAKNCSDDLTFSMLRAVHLKTVKSYTSQYLSNNSNSNPSIEDSNAIHNSTSSQHSSANRDLNQWQYWSSFSRVSPRLLKTSPPQVSAVRNLNSLSKTVPKLSKSCVLCHFCLHGPRYSQPVASTHSDRRVEVEDQPPSWLFVSSAAAGAYGAQVNVDLGHEDRLSGEALQTLEANVKSRCLKRDISGLLKNLEELKRTQDEKATLLRKKEEVLQSIRDAKTMPSTEAPGKELDKLVEHLRSLKAEITGLKSSWDLEEKVMLEALRLPNDLHPDTPLKETRVLREVKFETEPASSMSHVEIGRKFKLIKFSNIGPKAFFLKGDLVLAEMALTSTVCDFIQSKGYRHMSGPEFVKTPIIEGCGGDVRDGNEVLTMVDPHKTVIEPMNHLSGVSLHMFAAYVAKTCIGSSVLPLKMFACGRRYQNSDLPGLYGAIQTTQAAVFSCVTEEDVERQFESTLGLIWEFLEQLGFSLRLCQVCAKDLNLEEKRRVDIEMFSPHLNQYIKVASVSDAGDYISRRLMVSHNQNHADIRSAQYLHMVYGTVVNITSLLAIWMEHSCTNMDSFTLCPLPGVKKPSSVFS